MNQTQRIRLALLLTNLKLGGRFSFRTFTADASYPKDPDPKNWRTINGSKVHLTNGKIDGGAGGKFKGNAWVGKKSHGHNSFFPQEQMNYKESYKKKPEVVYEKDPPIQYVNGMKGKFKGIPAGHQQIIKELISDIKKTGNIPAGIQPEHKNLVANTVAALKAKKITPTAAQNIVATAMYIPSNLHLKELNEKWGAQEPPDMATVKAPAKPKTAKPEASKPTTPPASTMPKSDADTKAKEIISKMDSSPEHEHETILEEAGLSSKEKEAVMLDYEMDMMNGSNNAEQTLEKILSKKDGTIAATTTATEAPKPPKKGGSQWREPPALVKGLLNNMNEYDPSTGEGESIKEFVDALKNDDELPEAADSYLWIDPQSKGMELALETAKAFKAGDLTKNQALQALALAENNHLGKIENLIEKWYGANSSVKAGGFDPYDFSEQAVGWKLPKGTQMSFKSDSSAEFKQYKQKNAAACKKMTKKQTAGIWRYTAGSTHLRDWLVYGNTDDWYKDGGNESTYKKLGVTNPYKNGMTGAALQKVADDISAGLKKIGHEDIIVNRNCSLMDWATPGNPNGVTFTDLQKMAKTGEVFENKAFLSATSLEKSAYGNSQARRHIFVPKKANGGFIDSVSEYKDKENEFLLDKNTKTRIIKVEKDNVGTIHVYEEVVLDD